MKKLVRYQLSDFKNVFIVYFLIILALHIWVGIGAMISTGEGTYQINAADFSGPVVFFITALSCFPETFNMWMQNHISRKMVVKGLLAVSIITGVINAVFGEIVVLVFQQIVAGKDSVMIDTGFSTFFRSYMEQYGIVTEIALNILFVTIAVAAFMMIGYFISIIFYCAGKVAKMAIAIGLPVGFFVALPIILEVFAGTAVIKAVQKTFYLLIGATTGNPFYLIGTLTGLFVIVGAINYLIINRLQVKGR